MEIMSNDVGSVDTDEQSPYYNNTQDDIQKFSDDKVREFLYREFMANSYPLTDVNNPQLNNCFLDYVKDVLDPNSDHYGCPVKFDGVSCWPKTPSAVLSVLPCFAHFNGLPYDTSENATLYCTENGTWADRSFYNNCIPIAPEVPILTGTNANLNFYIGNSISLAAVSVALWIFISFKDLRCLRNTIHTNLLGTYFLNSLFWIISASLQSHAGVIISCSFFIALNYSILTNFFWMFVEGLYLYMLVVRTFSVETIKLRVYVFIGWGVSIPIVLTWILVRSQLGSKKATHLTSPEAEGMEGTCFLVVEDLTDWILRSPILFVLAFNIIFLVRIMWVLITKLRSANTVETQRYWKASKALLVLIPLLGLTYMVLIALPPEFELFRVILLSTQGFWVTVFYCFLNSEVRNSIRHHFERWRTERGIGLDRGPSVRQCRDSSSPRTRTDRISNYGRRLFGGKRESLCCSEVTTMSTFVTNGYNSQNTSALPQSSSNSQVTAATVLQTSSTSSPKTYTDISGMSLQPMTSVSQGTSPVSPSTALLEERECPNASNLNDALL